MPDANRNPNHDLFLKIVETTGRRSDPNQELNIKQIATSYLINGIR
jgi:hypothetical protein